jgi:methylated-DNA-[protein]-cysteine S-methyltransferase
MNTRHAVADTRLGGLTLVAVDDALTGVYFPGHWHLPPPSAFGARVPLRDDALLLAAADQLEEYLRGERNSFDLPLRLRGEEFQERVWALLVQIPFGATTTYGTLAAELGGDRALARAVGHAVGRNPISVIVPCHRVVGGDGSLTGYAGGLERKRFLLELEEPVAARSARLF